MGMYEYYFPATQTDNVVSITVCLIDNLQKTKYPTSCDMKVVSNVVNIDKFNQLTPKDKSFYIIDLCQQAIMSLVYEMQWNTEVFEHTYDKIISMGGLFREYWRKAKSSPNKQLKAQIYFEDDYIVHLRPSGNAPEFRCYVEAKDEVYAKNLLNKMIKRMEELR